MTKMPLEADLSWKDSAALPAAPPRPSRTPTTSGGGGFAETLAAETDHRFSNTCLGVAEILHIFLKVHSKLFLQFFNLSRLKSSPIGCVVFVCQEMYAFS